ncbi:hypothetical protein [Halanaeroarchaeum sp. HSR-CO]|uniref:hypothetical protein n=1 Tax=Halanaeroarchaeum sp. HSR-CO TaxID=2866382 RepID=UPI00217DADB5|nr:hypothetical protein [Halanaeroarchaeum sp. HSR-CO]
MDGTTHPNNEPVLYIFVSFIIIFGLVFLSSITDLRGMIIEQIYHIYILIVALIIAVYLVAVVDLVSGTPMSHAEPDSPLGILFSRGLGPLGDLVGELLQVLLVISASRTLTAGIILNQWNLNLQKGDYILMVLVALGLFVIGGLPVFHRVQQMRHTWHS